MDYRGDPRDFAEKELKKWVWIKEQTLKEKRKVSEKEYFEAMDIHPVAIPRELSYCCEYDGRINDDCSSCPLNWSESQEIVGCIFVLEHGSKKPKAGLYRRWQNATGYQEAAELAEKISKLPIRGDENGKK